MSFDIQQTIRAITESKTASSPRDEYLNVVGRDTRGTLSIVQFIKKETQAHGTAIFPTFRIDEARPQKEGITLPKVGTRCTNPFMIESRKTPFSADYARRDAKSFILATLGMSDSDVSAEDFAETLGAALSPEQPLRGMKIGYETYMKEKSNLVLVRFYPVAGQTAETTAENRASLDKDFPISR